MEQIVGACGCICSDCRLYNQECMGCHAIEGKPCWLPEVGLDVCDFFECAVMDHGFRHCGECSKIPCEKFWKNKNPKWTDEQHRQIVFERVRLLKGLAGN